MIKLDNIFTSNQKRFFIGEMGKCKDFRMSEDKELYPEDIKKYISFIKKLRRESVANKKIIARPQMLNPRIESLDRLIDTLTNLQ